MFGKRCWTRILLAAGCLSGQGLNAAEECGEVTIANMTWPSAELIAEIDRTILGEGYGCSVELVAGNTLPTIKTMLEQGEPDIAPEIWVNAIPEELSKGVADGALVTAAKVLQGGGEEGWWIPKYIADANPQIKTVRDALAYPELFPLGEDSPYGALHNCPFGWQCQVVTRNLFKAYGGLKNTRFVLVDTGSAAGLDGSIANAYERQLGWLGYYWAPTETLGRYDMVRLEMAEHDPAHWESCTVVPDCDDPKINGWGRSEVYSFVTGDFAHNNKSAMQYIGTRSWSAGTVSKLLAWMANNQATGEEAAMYFLRNHEEVWADWVSEDVMQRVKSAL